MNPPKEPYECVSREEPFVPAKETSVSAKEPYESAIKTFVFAKEPCIAETQQCPHAAYWYIDIDICPAKVVVRALVKNDRAIMQ